MAGVNQPQVEQHRMADGQMDLQPPSQGYQPSQGFPAQAQNFKQPPTQSYQPPYQTMQSYTNEPQQQFHQQYQTEQPQQQFVQQQQQYQQQNQL